MVGRNVAIQRRVRSLFLAIMFGIFAIGTQTRATRSIDTVQVNISHQIAFSEDDAWVHLETMMSFNPRYPGSEGINQTKEYIIDVLASREAGVRTQNFTVAGVPCQNIIGTWEPGNATASDIPITVIASHYDARARADRDPDLDNRDEPVPAANDGGSSTAMLLELSSIINAFYENTSLNIQRETWLVFFDAEDQGNGGMPGFNWIEGSTKLASELGAFTGPSKHVDTLVLLDMVGDDELDIDDELYSDRDLLGSIFSIGQCLGHGNVFPDNPNARHVIDDHLPFRNLGITVADVIDLDYPEWHTVSDDLAHVSKASIGAVGKTIEAFIAITLLKQYNLTVHDPDTGGTWTASGCTAGGLPSPLIAFLGTWWPVLAIGAGLTCVAIYVRMNGKRRKKT
nr:M28 family peptidase [Candidatus Sigynarchaeota archaeon]